MTHLVKTPPTFASCPFKKGDCVYLKHNETKPGETAEIIGLWVIQEFQQSNHQSHPKLILAPISETRAGDQFGETYRPVEFPYKTVFSHEQYVAIHQTRRGNFSESF